MLIDSEKLKQAILTTMPERSEVLLIVDNQPEAVVRCKDCKAWKQYDDLNLGGCELFPEYNKMGDWFCNFGERKEGDGDV